MEDYDARGKQPHALEGIPCPSGREMHEGHVVLEHPSHAHTSAPTCYVVYAMHVRGIVQ